MMNIDCFHGTSYENCESILKDGFRESIENDPWFGAGIYFFTEGISDPIRDSKEWAYFRAYDKEKRGYKYNQYAVLKAVITVDKLKFIDFTQNEALKLFNKIRAILQEKAASNVTIKDPDIMKEFAEDFGFAVAKVNVKIQFGLHSKVKIETRIPNTTILLVMKRDMASIGQIEKYETGEISDRRNVYELRRT